MKNIAVDRVMIEIIIELHVFFKDYRKIEAWLHTKNMNLGDCKPITLIASGRGKRVLQFIHSREHAE